MMSAERARQLRRWHREADRELRRALPRRMYYLGLELLIPTDVFTPSTSGSFHRMVGAEVRREDRVLDVGTGSGISAILAARTSRDVMAVDINPEAVAAARANAGLNAVADRIRFEVSDLFDAVEGRYDLITFNPPYRWFKARDWLERSTTDENYQALTRFMTEVRDHLRPGGRILLNFGTTGDIDYLHRLIAESSFQTETVAIDQLSTPDMTATYYVFRLRP
jgi:release factor glutamine methyltransferase